MSNKPYYYMAWDQNDNPQCNYTTESREPCWYRLYVAEVNSAKPTQLSGPLLRLEAKERLEQLKLLIGEDGQYDN
jgi:hypothetical protein